MGMDVYGKQPKTEVGRYFRANVWWWRPLWDYCAKLAPEIIPEDLHRAGHMNDGEGLDEVGARALAILLQAEIASGRCEAFATDRRARLAALPDETCPICQGPGSRAVPP